jgi:hypothetical protein
MSDRNVSLRRTVEQIRHCVQEALSVVENDEDLNSALDDLRHAQGLIPEAMKKIQAKLGTPAIARRPA